MIEKHPLQLKNLDATIISGNDCRLALHVQFSVGTSEELSFSKYIFEDLLLKLFYFGSMLLPKFKLSLTKSSQSPESVQLGIFQVDRHILM